MVSIYADGNFPLEKQKKTDLRERKSVVTFIEKTKNKGAETPK